VADNHFRNQVLTKLFHSWKNFADQNSVKSSQFISDSDSAKALSLDGNAKKKNRITPGQTGLRNLGNTCFVNSCLQCLSHTQPFRRYFLSMQERKGIQHRSEMDIAKEITFSIRKRKADGTPLDEQEQSLAVNTFNLFKVMWAANGNWPVISPSAFINSIWATLPEFRGYLQHDALEFLCNFLEKLDLDLRNKGFFFRTRTGQKQTVVSLFEGKVTSQVTCERCKNRSNREQPFSFVTLNFDPDTPDPNAPVSLLDCLTNFSNPEKLEDNYQCDKCKGLQSATKKVTISELPDVIVLHVNRIRWKGINKHKIQTKVDFPLRDLDLAAFASPNSKDTKYSLCGVVNHSGRHFGGGHYFSYCLNTESSGWVSFSDGLVTPATEQDVLDSQVYLLFYMRNPLFKV